MAAERSTKKTDEPHLSVSRYVVRPMAAGASEEELAAKVGALGSVLRLDSARGGFLVTLKRKPRSAREGWAALRRRIGAGFSVVPLLESSDGEVRYPTGFISVRLERALSDRELEEVARHLELEVADRSSFAPKQVRLRPRQAAGAYLPEVARRIAASTALPAEAVWLDAESRYRRSSR